MSLRGKTLFITGATRGIGKAIALRAARDGANITIAAKTTEPHPKLPGTIYTAAAEVEANGGQALAVKCDIRSEEEVENAISQTVAKFGGIDIVINNASAIDLRPTTALPMKKYDLMHQVNLRGTYCVSKLAVPFLRKASNPHILNLSPPLLFTEKWFQPHVAYSMAKYGMSLCVLGMAGEFRDDGIAVNALWPKTVISTAALNMINIGEDSLDAGSRTPEIMADAAYVILTQPSRSYTGHFTVDEDILRSQGINDFSQYATVKGNTKFFPDFFIEDDYTHVCPPPPAGSVAASATVSNANLSINGFESSAKLQEMNASLSSLPSDARSKIVDRIHAIFEFDIKNGNGKVQTFTLDLKNKPGSVSLGKGPGKADVVLSMADKDFASMMDGKLQGQKAFMSGKLKVRGNVMLATKLDVVLKSIRSKSAKL